MLSIESTEQLTGARISGDYWDLDELLTAIYEVIGDENRYYDYQGSRNRILGVCFEIRNAAQGQRNIEFVSNGIHKGIKKEKDILAPEKNVYFSVEILWPEMIFTAIALNDFVKLYNELVNQSIWNTHIAAIRKFQSLVANALEELLSEEHYAVFMQLLHSKSPVYYRYASQYVDVLNLEYLNLTKEERKINLGAFAIRLMVEDDEYVALKEQILQAASVTKNEIHELPISVNYPDKIEW